MRAALILVLALAFLGAPPVSLRLNARYAFAPVEIVVTVSVPRDARNRVLCIVYDSDDGGASTSCWPLAGDTAPITHIRRYVLGPGHYTFIARIGRSDGSEAQSSGQLVEVVSPNS